MKLHTALFAAGMLAGCGQPPGNTESKESMSAQELRAHPDHAGALFVAPTGYGQAGDRVRSEAAGFAHHFVKPVHPQRLIDALAAVPVSRK